MLDKINNEVDSASFATTKMHTAKHYLENCIHIPDEHFLDKSSRTLSNVCRQPHQVLFVLYDNGQLLKYFS